MDGPRFTKVGEIRVSLLWLNVVAVLVAIPVAIVFGLADIFLHGAPSPKGNDIVYFLTIFMVQVVVHELLHAAGYTILGGLRRSQLKFGVNWKAFAPYCNCLFPVALRPFRWVAILPTIVLFPTSLAFWLATETWWLAFMTAAVLLAGVGDIVVLFRTLKFPSAYYIVEHPSGIGGDLFVPFAEPTP